MFVFLLLFLFLLLLLLLFLFLFLFLFLLLFQFRFLRGPIHCAPMFFQFYRRVFFLRADIDSCATVRQTKVLSSNDMTCCLYP